MASNNNGFAEALEDINTRSSFTTTFKLSLRCVRLFLLDGLILGFNLLAKYLAALSNTSKLTFLFTRNSVFMYVKKTD